jgi:hypothetical protein
MTSPQALYLPCYSECAPQPLSMVEAGLSYPTGLLLCEGEVECFRHRSGVLFKTLHFLADTPRGTTAMERRRNKCATFFLT